MKVKLKIQDVVENLLDRVSALEETVSQEHQIEALALEVQKLRNALQTIVDDSDSMAGNPMRWPQNIAKQALGWTFKGGTASPPKRDNGDASQ